MADTSFVPGTVVTSEWLNDTNAITYGLASTTSGKGAALVANQNGGTLQDVADAAGKIATSMEVADIAAAISAARAAGGGDVVSLPSSGALSGTTPVEIVGDFGDGLLFDGRRATITGTGTAANQDGLLAGNKVGSIASSYFNKYKIQNLSFVGPGKVGASAGVHQQAAADIQMDNLHVRGWPVGILLEGGLSSTYTGITTRLNGIGVQAKVYDDGPGGLNSFSPNANSFYDLRNYHNDVAVKYDNNPAGVVSWFNCNFEGNNTSGNATDGVKVLELTEAGHHNFLGCHLESNAGQYGIYYDGFDAGKSLVLLGTECIDAVGTNLHMARGRLTTIGSRVTNTSSTHDIYINTGARATLIDTEGAVTGDLSAVVAIRDGRIAFGTQPTVGSPVFDMRSESISASSNIAVNFRNDSVQMRWQNTAGTRVAYMQTSATGNHTWHNDNASGGWAFNAGNTARMFIGRSGGMSIEPGADNTITCGSPTFRFSTVYAATGTINTSDAREKQQIQDLSEQEKQIALVLKTKLKKFKWNSDVEKHGEEAKWSFGVIAQEVVAAFEQGGLNASDYNMISYEEGRYGVNYSELLTFIVSSL